MVDKIEEHEDINLHVKKKTLKLIGAILYYIFGFATWLTLLNLFDFVDNESKSKLLFAFGMIIVFLYMNMSLVVWYWKTTY